MRFRGSVVRSTLADANESRDCRINADSAQVVIGIARPLYTNNSLGNDLDQSLYALNSATISLCLAVFPWTMFRKHKGIVRMHTELDLHDNIPTFIRITNGNVHEVNILDQLLLEAGTFYVMDCSSPTNSAIGPVFGVCVIPPYQITETALRAFTNGFES